MTRSADGPTSDPVDEQIRVVDYDPSWPERYAEEATLLSAALGGHAVGGIHHVGSTSVPGLMAKPVIDILVGVESLAAARPCIEIVAPLGYCHFPYRVDDMHWFCKPGPARRTHHLHLVPALSRRFADELAFRDYLRAHTDRARAYEQLKISLAKQFRDDREAYTEGKAEFIGQTLDLARAHP